MNDFQPTFLEGETVTFTRGGTPITGQVTRVGERVLDVEVRIETAGDERVGVSLPYRVLKTQATSAERLAS